MGFRLVVVAELAEKHVVRLSLTQNHRFVARLDPAAADHHLGLELVYCGCKVVSTAFKMHSVRLDARGDPGLACDDRGHVRGLSYSGQPFRVFLEGNVVKTVAGDDDRSDIAARQGSFQPRCHVRGWRWRDQHDAATFWCLLVTHDLPGLMMKRLMPVHLGLNGAQELKGVLPDTGQIGNWRVSASHAPGTASHLKPVTNCSALLTIN